MTYALGVYFLLGGAVLLVVGVHDASLTEAGFGITAGAAVLVLVSCVMFAACWQLWRLVRKAWPEGEPPASNSVVLVACLFSLLVGIYVFFSGIRTTNPQRLIVVFAALVFVLAGVLGLALFGRDLEGTFARVGGAVALTLLGTAIGVYEFWYQNQYVPSRAGGAVTLNVSLRRTGELGPFSVIRARIDYETIGGKSVSAIGSAYTLTGSQILRCHTPPDVPQVENYFQHFLLDPQKARFMADVREQVAPTVLAAGRFVADGKRLDPNVPASREFVFLVPRHRYQLLRFRAQLFAIPGSVQLSQSTPPATLKYPGNNELYEYWHIHDDSWAHDLVSGRERWVVTRYELVDPGTRALHSQPKKTKVSYALHVFVRFPRPTWSRGLPSERATLRLFAHSVPINAQEPGAASEPFADAELAVNKVTGTCTRNEHRRSGS